MTPQRALGVGIVGRVTENAYLTATVAKPISGIVRRALDPGTYSPSPLGLRNSRGEQ
jgi:hypothetical protein